MAKNRDYPEWDPSLAICNHPGFIRGIFRATALDFIRELREKYLHVILVPAPEQHHHSHQIRVAINHNPEWYRELWFEHARPNRNGKKLRSIIKKRRVDRALERIANGKDGPRNEDLKRQNDDTSWYYRYDTLMRDIIFQRRAYGFEDDSSGRIPPQYQLLWYFRSSIQKDLLSDRDKKIYQELLQESQMPQLDAAGNIIPF